VGIGIAQVGGGGRMTNSGTARSAVHNIYEKGSLRNMIGSLGAGAQSDVTAEVHTRVQCPLQLPLAALLVQVFICS